jgi:hypothetical protein
MIPVLILGAVVWKKKHLAREWVAGGVILVGYVLSSSFLPLDIDELNDVDVVPTYSHRFLGPRLETWTFKTRSLRQWLELSSSSVTYSSMD